MQLPEDRRLVEAYERKLRRDLRRDKPKLFQALEEFSNIRPDKGGWAHFRKYWPHFFPEDEYERAAEGRKPNILSYPYWLNQIWTGGDHEPYLKILLGIETAPGPDEEGTGTPEEAWYADLSSIPAGLSMNWDEGVFHYRGGCDFHNALHLLFQESWRARLCGKCEMKFIAKRAAQKYCSTDCSDKMQRELKLKWWKEHGESWRDKRSHYVKKGRRNLSGPRKAR